MPTRCGPCDEYRRDRCDPMSRRVSRAWRRPGRGGNCARSRLPAEFLQCERGRRPFKETQVDRVRHGSSDEPSPVHAEWCVHGGRGMLPRRDSCRRGRRRSGVISARPLDALLRRGASTQRHRIGVSRRVSRLDRPAAQSSHDHGLHEPPANRRLAQAATLRSTSIACAISDRAPAMRHRARTSLPVWWIVRCQGCKLPRSARSPWMRQASFGEAVASTRPTISRMMALSWKFFGV